MTKKFSWEVDKASLILRVTDGDRKTEWTVRKSTSVDKLRGMLGEMMLELNMYDIEGFEAAKQPRLTASEEAWEEQSSVSTQETTEAASKEALNAKVAQLNRSAQWWMDDNEESAAVAALPNYDEGEIQ